MSEGNDFEEITTLEESYKRLCDFEKHYYEKIDIKDDSSLEFYIDENLYPHSDNDIHSTNEIFETTNYSSYKNLFNDNYRKSFLRNLNAMKYDSLEKEIGKENLNQVIKRDNELNRQYQRVSKEKDLDNDGIPDRIDIDDNRNSVQTVGDLSSTKNATTASTQRYNEKTKEQNKEKKQKQNEQELEM